MPICHSDSLNYINASAIISLQVMITFVSGLSMVPWLISKPQIWKTEQSYLWNGNIILLLTWHRSEQWCPDLGWSFKFCYDTNGYFNFCFACLNHSMIQRSISQNFTGSLYLLFWMLKLEGSLSFLTCAFLITTETNVATSVQILNTDRN